jgi:hypothetical protein
VAHALGLRHLDHAVARLDTEGAPDDAAGRDVGEAEHRAAGWCGLQLCRIDLVAILAPDLDHVVELAVGERACILGRDLALVAQRQRHLAQLVVEQALGLAQHVPVHRAAHRQRRDHQHRQQRQQQAHAQRGAEPEAARARNSRQDAAPAAASRLPR